MPNSAKILCVEDSKNVQQMLSYILKKAGFEPIVALNGREGIEKAKTLQPDLILMDIMMPDVSGIQAIKRIKSDPASRDIPILVLSAYTTKSLIEQAIEAGAEIYLEKTIIPDKLVETIESQLNKEDTPSKQASI